MGTLGTVVEALRMLRAVGINAWYSRNIGNSGNMGNTAWECWEQGKH